MPRPSDVYATLGAPGVYQATPWTPCQLPNVYVFPPEEDNEDVYCLFHSGSASPTAFESFYRNPVGYSRRDPSSPTVNDLTTLDHALSYFQRQARYGNNASLYGSRSGWENGERIAMALRNYSSSSASSASSQSSSSDSVRSSSMNRVGTDVYSNAMYLVGGEQGLEEQRQGSHIPSTPASSRRSSIFGDRPPDYEIFETRAQEDHSGQKKSQTMTLRSRAAMALKALGRVGRSDNQAVLTEGGKPGLYAGPATHESWYESDGQHKKRNRKKMAQLFNSNSNTDVTSIPTTARTAGPAQVTDPSRPLSPTRDLKLTRRRSMTQLLGLTRRSIDVVTKVDNMRSAPSQTGFPSSPTHTSLIHGLELSRRRPTQLLGLVRSASSAESPDSAIAVIGAREVNTDAAEVRIVHSRISDDLPCHRINTTGPVTLHSIPSKLVLSQAIRSESPDFPATAPSTATLLGKRKSFLSRRSFSFLDFHRHLPANSTPSPLAQARITRPITPTTPSVPNSPDSFSEKTDSSLSVLAPTDDSEQPVVVDMRLLDSLTGVRLPAIVGQDDALLTTEIAPKLLSGVQLDLNDDIDFSSQFRPQTEEDGAESEAHGEPHILQLAVRLDSLSFDQLVFDPESFVGEIYG